MKQLEKDIAQPTEESDAIYSAAPTPKTHEGVSEKPIYAATDSIGYEAIGDFMKRP